MLKNFHSSYEQIRQNSERLLKWKLCPLYLSDKRVFLLYCLEPSVLASMAKGSVQDLQSYLHVRLH